MPPDIIILQQWYLNQRPAFDLAKFKRGPSIVRERFEVIVNEAEETSGFLQLEICAVKPLPV